MQSKGFAPPHSPLRTLAIGSLASCLLSGCANVPALPSLPNLPTLASARTLVSSVADALLPSAAGAKAVPPASATPAASAASDGPAAASAARGSTVASASGAPAEPEAEAAEPLTADTADAAAPSTDADPLQWWALFGDPEILTLIQAAQRASPTLASALGRIERARAERVAADAAWLPLLSGSAGVQRGRSAPEEPLTRTTSSGNQASWEIDLFGAGRASSAAQLARLQGAELAWHYARVSVAADTGLSYVGLRACEAQLAQGEADLVSREATVQVSEVAVGAGFLAPDQAALARAAAAQARAQLNNRSAQCQLLLKSLVALTGLDEGDLKARLQARQARLPSPPVRAPDTLPADLLGRRPDLQEAAKSVAAAAADQRAAEARRWPSVSLQGTVGSARATNSLGTLSGQVWSLGPLQVTFPVFDGGVRKANVLAAQASYTEAQSLYQAKLRGAVREVEEALITLRSIQERERDARQAALGFGLAMAASEQRLKNGMANVLELEETRRVTLAARTAVLDLQQARANAWIGLYRALGGGWKPSDGRPDEKQG